MIDEFDGIGYIKNGILIQVVVLKEVCIKGWGVYSGIGEDFGVEIVYCVVFIYIVICVCIG